MANTIDIIIKLKEVGAEALKATVADLQKLKENVSAVAEAQLAPLREDLAGIAEIARDATNKLARIKEVVLDTVSSVVSQTREQILGGVEQTSHQSLRVVEMTMARLTAVVGAGFFVKLLRDVGVFSGIVNRDVNLIGRGVSSLFGMIGGIGLPILDRFKSDFATIHNILFAGGLFNIGYLNSVMALFGSFFRSAASFTGLLPLMLGQTFFLLKRITGQGSAINTPLQHAQVLMTNINTSLNSAYFTIHKLLVPAIGVGLMGAFFGRSGLFTAIPTAINGLISGTMSLMQYVQMRIFKSIGIGKGALFTMFFDVRKFLLAVLPDLMKFVPAIHLIAKLLDKINPVIKSLLKSKQFEAFFEKIKAFVSELTKIPILLRQIAGYTARLGMDGAEILHVTDVIPERVSRLRQGLNALFSLTGRGVRASWEGIKTLGGSVKTSIIDALPKAGAAIGKMLAIPARGFSKISSLLVREKGLSAEKQLQARKQGTTPIEAEIAELFSFEKIQARGKQFETRTRQYLKRLLQSLFDKSLWSEPGKQTALLKTFFAEVFAYKGKIEVPADLVIKVSEALNTVARDLSKFGVSTKEKGNLGALFLRGVTESLKKDAPREIRASIEQALAGIQGVLLASIPQTKESGKKIIEQLVQGIVESRKELDEEVTKSAQDIADHFPQSPARKGPLKKLIRMGFMIGSQISAGMITAKPLIILAAVDFASSVIRVVSGIAGKIASASMSAVMSLRSLFNRLKPHIDEIRSTLLDAFRFGEAPGTVALIEQFKLVGVSAMETGTAISRINKALAGSADEAGKIKSLGIDLESVRQSGDPVVTLFAELSDVVANATAGTREMDTALELLGTSISSNLVLALKGGGEAFRRDFAESMRNTIFLTGELRAKMQEFQRFWMLIWQWGRNMLAAVLNEILPDINKQVGGVYEFLKRNTAKIAGLLIYLVTVARSAFSLIWKMLKNLVSNPGQMIGPLWNIVKSTAAMVLDLLSVFTDSVYEKFMEMGETIWSIVQTIASGVFDSLTKILPTFADLVISLLASALGEIFIFLDSHAGEILSWIGKLFYSVIKAILGLITEMSQRITIFLSMGFDSILKYVKAKIAEIVHAAIALLTESIRTEIEGNAALRAALELIFGKQFLDVLIAGAKVAGKNAGQALGDAERELAEHKKKIATAAKAAISVDLSFEGDTESREAWGDFTTAANNFKAAMGESWEIMRASIAETSDDIATLKEQGKDLLAGAFSEESVEKYKTALRSYFDEVKSAVGEMPAEVQSSFDALVESVNLDNYESAVVRIEEMLAGVQSGIKDVTAAAEESSEKLDTLFSGLGETVSNLGQAFTNLYEMSGKKLKEFFILSKAAAISEIIITTASGIMKALTASAPGVPLGPMNYAQAAAITAAGTVQLAKVTAEAIQGFAAGGFVSQGTGATKDDVPALLARGEFVQPANVVDFYGREFMERLRSKMIPRVDMAAISVPKTAFQTGGAVGTLSTPATAAQAPVVNIANIVDQSMIQRFFASQDGRRALYNVISDNAPQFRAALGSR